MNETKRDPAISVTIITNDDGRPVALYLRFANGEELAIPASQLADIGIKYATIHGVKQKLVDAAAISRNPETGRPATIEDKYNAVREAFERLMA